MRFVALSGSPQPTHGVDIGGYLEAGVASLRCHEVYLAHLGDGFGDAGEFLESAARGGGELAGMELATTFEVINF